MKFKIVEEFMFYRKMYNGQNYSFEKNPLKWKLPVRAWVHKSGNIYTAFAEEGENRLIHHRMAITLDLPDVSENWDAQPITDWVAVYINKGGLAFIGESYDPEIVIEYREEIREIFGAAHKKNPAITFIDRKRDIDDGSGPF